MRSHSSAENSKDLIDNSEAEDFAANDDVHDFDEYFKEMEQILDTKEDERKDGPACEQANNDFFYETENKIWDTRLERRDSSPDFTRKFEKLSEERKKNMNTVKDYSFLKSKNLLKFDNPNDDENSHNLQTNLQNFQNLKIEDGSNSRSSPNTSNFEPSYNMNIVYKNLSFYPSNYTNQGATSSNSSPKENSTVNINFNNFSTVRKESISLKNEKPFFPKRKMTPPLEAQRDSPTNSETYYSQKYYKYTGSDLNDVNNQFSYPVDSSSSPNSNLSVNHDYLNYSMTSKSTLQSSQGNSPFLANMMMEPINFAPRNLCNTLNEEQASPARGKKHFDDAVNRINLDNILRNKDKRTTLMIRHIPNKYNLYTFLEDINLDFKGTYDVFYLPIDYKNNCNLGFAFINFVDPMHILGFYENFRGKRWRRFKSDKICELAYAKFQGKEELKTHFLNGSVIKLDSEDKKPVILPTPDPLPPVQIPLV